MDWVPIFDIASVVGSHMIPMVEAHANLQTGSPLSDTGQIKRQVSRINPTNRELRFTVPLTDDGNYLGDVDLAVSPQDALAVDAPRLLELLRPILQQAVYNALAKAVPPAGRLDENALGKEGIRLSYDAERLALAIDIPVKKRTNTTLSLRANGGTDAVTFQPAAFSGYLNIQMATDLVEAGQSTGITAPTAAIDGALRLYGVVMENEAYISGRSGDPTFRRVGSKLVYDDMKYKIRWTLGDTSFLPRQFQASPSVLGLNISRLYNRLDPQRQILASGTQSFSLSGPSVIETFVNGRSVERRTFQPGNYTLQDFPIAQGSNMVKLKIEDAGGAVRTIDFSVYANQLLLAKGITEFSLVGGVYSTPTTSGIVYSKDWITGGFIRKGVGRQLTLGANFQADSKTGQLGGEVLWGSPIGLAGFSLTSSHDAKMGDGLAAVVTYERLLSRNGAQGSDTIHASVEWRSMDFVVPNEFMGQARSQWRTGFSIVHTMRGNSYIAAGGQYSQDYDSNGGNYGARLSGGIDFNMRLTGTAELGFDHGSPQNGAYVRLGLRMRFASHGSAQLDTDSMGRAQAAVSASGGNGNNAWFASGSLSRQEQAVSFNANANLATNRAEIGVQQTANYDKVTGNLSDARTTIRTAFAMAFADGAFTVGRKITEAFIIAEPHRSLQGKTVYLEPDERGEAARSGKFGPALDGQLSAHSFRTLVYQVPEAPAGYDLGAGNITIQPPYRSGYRLVIGSDYHLLVIGRLIDRHDAPITLLAGRAIDLGNPKHPAITVFTGRDGRFGAQGLRPGRWRIEMPTNPPLAFEFQVTDNADGIVRMGDLRPAQPKGEKQ